MHRNNLTDENQKKLETFGIIFRELRRSQGMSQNELSHTLHRNTIIRIENAKNVTLLSILKLADALDVELKELFEMVE
jgi:transcriptional regulator with XRE-family HTH domain